MKTNIKIKSDFLRELKVDLKWSDIEKDYTATYNKLRSNYQIKGFRKGKVPIQIFKKNVGTGVDSQFIDDYINEYFRRALEESKLYPLNQGQITKIDFDGEKSDLSFIIVFEVTPEFKLPNYTKKTSISTTKYIANSKDVNQSIEDIRHQHAKSISVERPLKTKDFIFADFCKQDEQGNPIETDKLPNHHIRIGEGLFTGKLEKSFIGKKVGDWVNIVIPQNSGDIKYSVKINKIEEQVLPDINDDLASLVDSQISSLKELKKKIKENIQANLDNENKKEFNEKIIDYFTEKTKFEPPASMVENYKNMLIEDYKSKQPQGVPIDEEKISKEYEEISSKNVKWFLIKSVIIKDEKINVTEKDLNDKIKEFETMNPNQVSEIKKFYKEDKNKNKLKEDLINYNLFNSLENYFINKVKEISTDKIREKKDNK